MAVQLAAGAPGAAPFTIEGSARLVGAWVWLERRLYEAVGGWTGPSSAAAAKIWFSEASQHHAWRASLWDERLPGRLVQAHAQAPAGAAPGDGAGPADELVKPACSAAEAAVVALAGLSSDGARLGAYCRVILPRTIVAYRAWQRRCSASADRPVARSLSLALVDAVNDWQRGAAVLTRWSDRPRSAEDRADVVAGAGLVEAALIGEGLFPQLVTADEHPPSGAP